MISLSRFLAEHGCSVSIAAYDVSDYPSGELLEKEPEGVDVYRAHKPKGRAIWNSEYRNMVFRLAAENQYDICISSVGPYDSMYFLPQLRQRFKLPYIIDYRDHWGKYNRALLSRTEKIKMFTYSLIRTPIERKAMKTANCVVTVSPSLQQVLQEKYNLPEQQCKLIYNGYGDSAEMCANHVMETADGEFVLSILGKFSYYNRDAAREILAAVARLRNDGTQIVIEHMGTPEPEIFGILEQLNAPPKTYRYVGRLSYQEALKKMASANAALQVYLSEYGLGTKVFDYIAVDKPLLYVGTVPSELADFIGQFKNSFICSNDEKQIYQALKKLTQERPSSVGCGDPSVYSRRVQNERYLQLLTTL